MSLLSRKTLLYLLCCIAQILLCNFFRLSPYLLISILPLLILCLPIRWGSVAAMLLAFGIGLGVDFFSDGMLGLTSTALVAVAFCRRFFIGLVFGEEVFAREEDLSPGKHGLPKFTIALLMACGLYFLLYIWADAAGTARFWPSTLRWVLSTLVSTIFCLLLADQVSRE